MFRFITIILLLASFTATAQQQSDVREFTGTVTSFDPGFGFAYERMNMDVAGTEESFLFYRYYGKLILSKVRTGDQVSVRVKIAPVRGDQVKRLSKNKQSNLKRDYMLAIKLNDQWVDLSPSSVESTVMPGPASKTFFNMRVKDTYEFQGHPMAIIFDNGLVACYWYAMKNAIKKGDVISFAGHRMPSSEGYQYPVPDVKEVYIANPLAREEGNIKSLIFKQNYVCIGMVVKTKNEEFRLGFPSNYARRIQQLAMEDQKIVFFFNDFPVKIESDPPALKAIVYNKGDTLKIEVRGIYEADIKHDHKPVAIKGKITKVNRSDKGRIMSLIIGTDCYVEVDYTMEKQLGNFFKKGELVEVSGDERIKAQGEVYSKDYRIITPRSLVIDGKNFLLGQQP